jgi:DNA polymerase-2
MSSFRGFVLKPTYRIDNGRPIVELHGRLEDGRTFVARDDRETPHFYLETRDAARAREQQAPAPAATPLVTMEGQPVSRVDVAVPPDVPKIRERLRRAGIAVYEADVRFAMRYLIDRDVRGSLAIGGEGRPGDGFGMAFHNPEITPADWTPRLSVLSLDIETDPRAHGLLSIALHGCGASEVLFLAPPGGPGPASATPFATEKDLLLAFARRVRELDPDVVTGWNVVDFDLGVLARVAERHKVRLELGRGAGPLRLRGMRGDRGSRQADVPGRVVLDGIHLLRGAFVRMEDYGLDAVAREVLGEGKTLGGHGSGRAEEILRLYRDDPAALVEYNRTDARLALGILEKLQLVELAVERSRLTGLPLDRVSSSIAAFDFLYLGELRRRGIVSPSVESVAEVAPMGGGHVLEPQPGLHRNVIVLDFRSLYPSLIRTFQIDPWNLVRGDGPVAGADLIRAPNGASFHRRTGILTTLLDTLLPLREQALRDGQKVKSQAIKILMNSFYGVLGTPACRFYDPRLANAITSFGREMLLWCQDRLEARGLRVLYGDTDSLFALSGADDPAAARALGERTAETLNVELRAHLKERYRVESRLELRFERLYERLFLPAVRHGTSGARKRYAGLVEGGKVVFTGMEAVRGDWTDLAKDVQRELFARLFTDRSVREYLRDVVADVRAGRLDERLVYRKGLRKAPEAYTATTPPHVAAARKMSGPPRRRIAYVVTRDGPEPLDGQRSPLDHEHYVAKQVRPVAEPVLALLGLEFDEVIGDRRQLSLF